LTSAIGNTFFGPGNSTFVAGTITTVLCLAPLASFASRWLKGLFGVA